MCMAAALPEDRLLVVGGFTKPYPIIIDTDSLEIGRILCAVHACCTYCICKCSLC